LESDQTERAARAQLLRRDHTELQQLQARLEVLYEDRLEQRIDAATYDRNAQKISEQRDLILRRIQIAEKALLAPVGGAVDFLAAISEAARSFTKPMCS
jgi:hypothetical protein